MYPEYFYYDLLEKIIDLLENESLKNIMLAYNKVII
jgi:hypothetical protein